MSQNQFPNTLRWGLRLFCFWFLQICRAYGAANLPEYRNVNECKTLVNEVANELKIKSPSDFD